MKKFDKKKIPENILENILEAARLSPSSLGLQPYRIIVVESNDVKKKLSTAFYNKNQILTCSHFIIFTGERSLDKEYIDKHFEKVFSKQGADSRNLELFRGMIDENMQNFSAEQKYHWIEKQIYIALGMLLSACALEKIDSCPMEGFDAKMIDSLLGLKEKNLRTCVGLAIGYRSEHDEFQHLKKSRKSKDEFFIKV